MNRDELIEKMMDAYYEESEWRENPKVDPMTRMMAAALDAVLGEVRQVVARTLRNPPQTFFAKACDRYVEMVDAEIARYSKVKTAEERVTIVPAGSGYHAVEVNGLARDCRFWLLADAELFRNAIIAQLKNGESQ